MNTKTIFLIIFLFGNTAFSVAQINLQTCIDLAQKNNPQFKMLGLVRDAEQIQLDILKKNFMPQTSVGGQASWQSAVTSLPISLPNFTVPTIPKDQYKATLDLNQAIWDGGANKSQQKFASATSNAELKSIDNVLYQTKEQVSNLFFGVLLANQQLLNFDLNLSDLENQLKKIKANVTNGTAIKSNVYTLEARIIELNQAKREVLSRKLSAIKALGILTGQEFDSNIRFEEPNNIMIWPSDLIERPELRFFEAQIDLLEANKSLVEAKYAPKLNLFATGGYGRPGLNFLSPDFSTYFIGGLALKIPISHFYLKTKQSDYKQIAINQYKIEIQKESFLQQIQIKLSAQKEDISKLKDQLEEDKKLIEIRAYMKKTAESKLENGIITVSDYITELDNETMAKQNFSLHKIQLSQILQNMNFTIGK